MKEQVTYKGKPPGTPAEPVEYSYMEFVTAGSMSKWHIRKLTAQGRKLNGGIDTAPLCGRTWDDGSIINGWDLSMNVERRYNPSTCPGCLEQYKELMKGEPTE